MKFVGYRQDIVGPSENHFLIIIIIIIVAFLSRLRS